MMIESLVVAFLFLRFSQTIIILYTLSNSFLPLDFQILYNLLAMSTDCAAGKVDGKGIAILFIHSSYITAE